MTRRFLIVAALLAAGCEQLKAPKRLKELETRVDDLTAQVEAMKGGKPGASLSRSRIDGHKGSGDAAEGSGDHAGSREAHDGSGEHAGSGEPAVAARQGSDEAHEGSGDHAGSGERTGSDERAGAGERTGSDEHAAASEAHDDDAGVGSAGEASTASDGGPVDALSKTDRALADIAQLMASTRKQVVDSSDKSRAAADKHAADKHLAAGKPPSPPWSYDGKAGPPAWGKLDPAWRACSDGKAQSPIDIEPRPGSASPIVFHYAPTAGTLRDDGHALQLDLAPGNSIEIDDHTYQLVQIQVHRPSEHAIAGEHYPLEVQLVHKDSKNRLAMIAVLYDAGAESRALGALWSRWPRKAGLDDKLRAPFDPSALLPDTRTVFRYPGSLTRPPCTEGVIWNVMRRTMTEARGKLDALGQHYKINGRETQPLNGRKVE